MERSIREKVNRLLERMHKTPQYPTQGATLFVDLEKRESQRAYLPQKVVTTFLGGRGANMYLLYNLLLEEKEALDPEVPLIFGSGVLTSTASCATRGNFTSCSPDSHAILDTSGGDYFPSFLKRHGYDHLVLYGKNAQWTLLKISGDQIDFLDATGYLGMNNLEFAETIEKDFDCKERKDMAMARITSAGENLALNSGIMGGIKAIWARGGGGAKMGSLALKGIMVYGKPPAIELSDAFKEANKKIRKKVLSTSVIRNALKKVGTPFLYKPSRVLGALGTKNNQETGWYESLDADNFDPYRPGMDGCFKCPVRCRAKNDMTPEGKSGWGANALKGLTGNASYDKAQAEIEHKHTKKYKGIHNDNVFDKYDKGDGPEYVTVGKFGPNIGLREPEHILRLNNILNDLGLDSASTGGAIGWALELFERGIITLEDTGGLDLSYGNYEAIERLLFMTAKREGFGDVVADSGRAVEYGKYPEEALKYRMTVKGLFQSDPHDARILKAFALGLSVATRGMDHLRNRATLEINARINDDQAFKTALYGGLVSPEPNSYEGKEYAVRRCEDIYAAGDAVGMCRFDTQLFNSPSLPNGEDFSAQIKELTGIEFTEAQIIEVGKNITGLERMINFRLGLRGKDDTLPRRWFEEGNTSGPFKGEKIEYDKYETMKARFYQITDLNIEGTAKLDWHEKLSSITTGFAIRVTLPQDFPGAPEQAVIIDEYITNINELWEALRRKLPEASSLFDDLSLSIAVNDQMILSGANRAALKNGDQVSLVPALAGG
ncbi:MAG: aldehyde ferredoxin oxidoreductase [SAR324 cluster bacterium]|uniref:Aldehyde ferredoxin oxidoreductase n=1 Tax=SAR324 cluster bacterium TaxID=2024889 RepID=A0A2A4SRX0_9DELT|nr:MAG: aldehyde ferredoxin oxidoreductase [SAR324 cluster bacterium]